MNISTDIPKQERLTSLLAKVRALKAGTLISQTSLQTPISPIPILSHENSQIGMDGSIIHYNQLQQSAVSHISSGESCIVIGAAGTGKTTCMRGGMEALILSGKAGILHPEGHKHLTKDGSPGIVIVSFTRRAVANIRKVMPDDLKDNCLTIHALLEYEPVFYTILDEITGEERNTMKFEPTRNSYNPLPTSIRTCVIEESSMVSVELFNLLVTALPDHTQFVFLGDIQQLPPVFGSAILGFKMLELPCIELKEVYRQALESPIIRLAHRVLSGNIIPHSEYSEWKSLNLTIHPWKKKLSSELALLTAAKFFTTAIDSGAYNPYEDMILLPFNKAFGTIELNKHIANYLAKREKKVVHEIISGFNKNYLSIGDKVLYDKEDAIVVSISRNLSYSGKEPQPAADTLDYWGYNSSYSESKIAHSSSSEEDDADLDFMLSQSVRLGTETEERVRQASHIVTVRMCDTEKEIPIDSAADINSLLLSYALTVHKSQGSEFRKVFLTLHQSHATMVQRELLYTAITRAKEELYIICEPETFTNGIRSQRIKGNTLEEKAEYFKGKKDSLEV